MQPQQKEKKRKQNTIIWFFWQSVKVFSNRKPINSSLHKQRPNEDEVEERERFIPKRHRKTEKNQVILSEPSALSLMRVSAIIAIISSNMTIIAGINQMWISSRQCVCACALWIEFQAGFFSSVYKLSTQAACLFLAFLSILRNCSVSLAVLPTIVIAQTIRSKRIQSKGKKIELHKCTFMFAGRETVCSDLFISFSFQNAQKTILFSKLNKWNALHFECENCFRDMVRRIGKRIVRIEKNWPEQLKKN